MAGPTFFTDFRVVGSTLGETPGKLPWARAITSSTDMRQAIAEAKGSGAAGIKIYANLPKEEIQRIAAEGHKQGLKIWSHAGVFPARPIDAVLAGVDVISHCGLLAWESAGLTPIQALQSATRINAEALGIEDRTGTIEKGKRADLVILSADPSADIRNARKIRYVIKGGKIYVRQ